jgi:hypothetical protein
VEADLIDPELARPLEIRDDEIDVGEADDVGRS